MKTVCGLDVHKSMIHICILKENDSKIIKEFSTLTVDIYSMCDLMKEHGVEEVGMESTGIYGIPIWRILQGHFLIRFQLQSNRPAVNIVVTAFEH